MPYSNVSELPDAVKKKFSPKQQAQYLAVWNSTYQSRIEAGDSPKDAETRAFQTAYGVAEKSLEKSLSFFKGLVCGIDEYSQTLEPLLKVMEQEERQPLKHVNYKGIPIVIEYKAGEIRPDPDSSAPRGPWVVGPNWDYGYIMETKSNEVGDELDCYLGRFENNEVYLAYVKHPDGSFDEVKVMIGFIDQEDAKKAVMYQYAQVCERPEPDMVTMTIPQFLETLENDKMSLGRTSPNTAVVTDQDPEKREPEMPEEEELDELTFKGISIVIEHNGLADYGYIENDLSDREEKMNVCCGTEDSDRVVLISLADEGKVDGVIAYLGFSNVNEAQEAFAHQFPSERLLSVTVLSLDQFKKFLAKNKLMGAPGPELMEKSLIGPRSRSVMSLMNNPPFWLTETEENQWIDLVARAECNSYVQAAQMLKALKQEPLVVPSFVIADEPIGQPVPEQVIPEPAGESPMRKADIQAGGGIQIHEHVNVDGGASEALMKMIGSMQEKLERIEARPSKVVRKIERDHRGLVTRIVEEDDGAPTS